MSVKKIFFVILILLLPFVFANDEKFNIKQIELKVIPKKVQVKRILESKINQYIEWEGKLFLFGDKEIYFLENNQIVNLKTLVNLPKKFNWFKNAFIYKDYLLLSVAEYSATQKQKDENTPLGGFTVGPVDKGILMINLKDYSFRLIEYFYIKNYEELKNKNQNISFDKNVMLSPEKYFFDQKTDQLFIANFGLIGSVDIEKNEVKILWTDAIPVTRRSVFIDGSEEWFTANEGGLDGSWIEKFTNFSNQEKYYPLNNAMVYPDSIIKFNSKIYFSGLAGLIGVDLNKSEYTQFVFEKNNKKKAVFELNLINNHLTALSDMGWLIFDLEGKKVYRYQFKNVSSNEIYSFYFFNGKHFISNKEATYMF